MASVPITLLN